MEDKLRELKRDLGMVTHIESIRRAQLLEENELLKSSYRNRKLKGETICQFWKEKNNKKVP